MKFTHVLITRPEPEAGELAHKLESAGITPVVSPALEFESRRAGIDFDRLWRKGSRKMVVFCSPRAVRFGLEQLPVGFLDGVHLAAIGPATAAQLEDAGLSVDLLPDPPYTSESLLADRVFAGESGQALLLTSPGGRLALQHGLRDKGWQVTFAHVYRAVLKDMEPAVEAQIMGSKAVASVWTSSRVMLHLSQSMRQPAWDKLCRGLFLVTSTRLAEKATALFGVETAVAPGPGNDDIFAALNEAAAN